VFATSKIKKPVKNKLYNFSVVEAGARAVKLISIAAIAEL
jgi:hypothetical protein